MDSCRKNSYNKFPKTLIKWNLVSDTANKHNKSNLTAYRLLCQNSFTRDMTPCRWLHKLFTYGHESLFYGKSFAVLADVT